jgi:hypothetical protein
MYDSAEILMYKFNVNYAVDHIFRRKLPPLIKKEANMTHIVASYHTVKLVDRAPNLEGTVICYFFSVAPRSFEARCL